MEDRPVDVLIVDDSAVVRMFLVHLLQSDPQIRVIGSVNSGEDALVFVRAQQPDVVLMDIHMPGMDGFETTRRIMETHPVPIVICTATTSVRETATSFRVMEAGAVACVAKPVGREHPDFEEMAEELLQTLKLMSEVKVVRRWSRTRNMPVKTSAPSPAEWSQALTDLQFVAIGASTGGPPVLQSILTGISTNCPVPILIVQHIARGFLPGLVEWLNDTTGTPTHTAVHGALPLPGHAYLAPDDLQMGVSSSGRINLTRGAMENGLRPAVAHLFRSLVEACGPRAVGVLLTGMGRDGAAELKLMKDAGAITIAQDRESSVVHGMAGEAIKLGAVSYVWPAEKIAEKLLGLFDKLNTQKAEP